MKEGVRSTGGTHKKKRLGKRKEKGGRRRRPPAIRTASLERGSDHQITVALSRYDEKESSDVTLQGQDEQEKELRELTGLDSGERLCKGGKEIARTSISQTKRREKDEKTSREIKRGGRKGRKKPEMKSAGYRGE